MESAKGARPPRAARGQMASEVPPNSAGPLAHVSARRTSQVSAASSHAPTQARPIDVQYVAQLEPYADAKSSTRTLHSPQTPSVAEVSLLGNPASSQLLPSAPLETW